MVSQQPERVVLTWLFHSGFDWETAIYHPEEAKEIKERLRGSARGLISELNATLASTYGPKQLKIEGFHVEFPDGEIRTIEELEEVVVKMEFKWGKLEIRELIRDRVAHLRGVKVIVRDEREIVDLFDHFNSPPWRVTGFDEDELRIETEVEEGGKRRKREFVIEKPETELLSVWTGDVHLFGETYREISDIFPSKLKEMVELLNF